MTPKDWPRAVITAAVLALFAFAYLSNPSDEMMKGALIAAFTSAVAYWLGSSKGSADKSSQLEEMQSPRSVRIDQPDSDPIPVEEKR